jgi:tetratricopeptide (TPR) repeat protein
MMHPGIRPGESPPFHELGEYVFQELCRDLFDAEPAISTCEIYGERGQSQDGIDLLAYRADGDGIEVGQCKCYEDFPPREISKASDEFFAHWDRWSKENVKRFILFVASDLTTRQRQDEIIKQKKCFADFGIKYEAWSAAKIRNRLRPHRGIVATYCTPADYWVSVICGEALPAFSSTEGAGAQISIAVQAAVVNQLELFTGRLSGETEERLELMRAAWREGRRKDAIEGLQGLKGDPALWPFLSPEVQAKLLRFEASLELDVTGDVNRAKHLADEARTLLPSDDETRLRAFIAYAETGPEAAIELLAGQEDVDSLNLRAAFLHDIGRVDEGRKVLEFEGSGVEPNAETFRIRALSYLASKDLSQAQLAIQKALELQPRWVSIRFTAATIDYFSALSPAVLPDRIVLWPEPVDWTHVKRDDESLTCLRKAVEVLQALVEETENTREEEQRLEAWRLACLANDPERQEEAIEYCRVILGTDPTHYPAIAWVVARNFDVDLKPSETALEKLVTDGLAAIPHVLALVSCYLKSGRANQAIQLLAQRRPVFQKHQADALWTFWHVQALVISGDPEAALAAIDSSAWKTQLRHAQTIALGVLASETGDWQQLIQHLESSYEETGDPNFLFDCCGLMAQQQNWAYVADRAEQLVEEFATSEVLRFAAIATYNDQRFDLCLRLLDDHRELFRHRRLPGELRRIQAFCQHALGILPEAIVELEALTREEPTTENLLAVAQLYFAKGDLKRLALVARQLNRQPDLAAEPSLRIAQLVQWEDRELAISLWRKAVSRDLPDSSVGPALALGYQLGLDKELRPLMARVAELGHQGRGGIQVATIDDFIGFAAQQRKHGAKLDEAYRNGTVPIHVIAEQLNWPLVDLYHRLLEEHETAPDPIRQPSLLVRHGGRALVYGFPDSIPKWRLNLDVTAVLLAAHLEILDEVEKAFKPLRIPADVIPALVRMRDRVTHHQPSRFQACRQIIDLVEMGALEVVKCDLSLGYSNVDLVDEVGEEFVALFENARASGGYLVDFLPLKKRDLSGPPSALPEDASQYLVNCRGLVEALREQGPLSDKECDNALEELGYEGCIAASEAIPEEGSPLYCHANIPEVLADAKLLNIVCERFQVRIEQRDFDRVRNELKEHEQRQIVAKWLDRLIDRISKGIDSGTYEIIPTPPFEGGALEEASAENPELGCLVALLRFEARQGDIIWVDDRYMNAYLRRDSVPIIGVNEVLKALVSVGALEINNYYDKVNRLRSANVRFIPVQTDEILYYLRQARVGNGTVIETQGLSTLRRYVATCLLRGDILQRPPMPDGSPNKDGELAFLLSLDRAIINALVELWATENDESTCRARVEWLMTNLYVDHLGLRKLISLPGSEQDALYLVAITLAGLISQAMALGPSRSNDRPLARHRYFDWLFSRVLRKRFRADPHLVVVVADVLKKTLLDVQEETLEEKPPEIVITWVLQEFYQDLPKPIRDELGHDTDFMASIGFRPTVTIDGLHFDPDNFWRAAAEAVNGREATIVPIELDEEVNFEPFDDGHGQRVFCFNHPVTGEREVVSSNGLDLLLDSPMEREAALRRHRNWFDCPDETFEQVVAEIVSTEDPWRRIEEAESWRNSSAAIYYANLYQQLSERQQFQVTDLLPPSAEGLLRHFRLEPSVGSGEAFQKALATAALNLIREENLSTAIDRLIGLPVSLPAVVVEAIAELSPKDRRMLIKQLLRTAGSPVCKVHFVYLLLHFGDETPAFRRLARLVVMNLLSTEVAEEFEAFLAILRWANDEFNHWPNMRIWPPHIRLAMVWAHAHRLFTIFSSLGAPASWLQDTFSQMGQRIPFETFERDPDYWFDIAHPRQVSRVTLLLGGLSYSLGEDVTGFVDKGLRDLFAGQASTELEGIRLPVLPLLRDPTQVPNSLASFLGGDRGEKLSALLGVEDAGALTRSSLQALAEQMVDKLAEASDEFWIWSLLNAVLGDSPPYDNLVDRLKSIILQTDFVSLFEKNADLGYIALQTASLQVINLGDEYLRSYLKDQLVKIAQLFADLETGEVGRGTESADGFESGDMCRLLIESVLNISIAVQLPQDVIAEFADLLTQLVGVWHSMIPVCRPIVQRLCEELPIAQGQQFWPLLVRLRAE